MAVNVSAIKLYVDGQPVFLGKTNDENWKRDMIEVTSKMSGGNAEFKYGKFTGTCSADGLFCETGRNLLSFSEDFSNSAWTKNGVTVTQGSISGPSGRLTGATVSGIVSGDSIYQTISGSVYNTTATVYTFSIALRGTAGQTIKVYLRDSGGYTYSSAITLTTSFARYSVSFTSAGDSSNIEFGVRSNSDTASSVYVAEAQVEAGSTATDYQQAGYGYSYYFNALKNKTTVTASVTSYIDEAVLMTGSALVSSIKRTAAVEDAVVFSIELQFTGAVSSSTI